MSAVPGDAVLLATAPTRLHRALDGLSRAELEHLLHRAHGLPGPLPHRRLLVEALVHLRRTGRSTYRFGFHASVARYEAPPDPVAVRHLVRVALAPATRVRILGEPHHGTVRHLVVSADPPDARPAPWYVVAVDALERCRAHGSDELELCSPAPGPRSVRTARR
ncbi:hypothetical protein ACWD6I_09170 [Streptomyces sp. NPDC002454]